MEGKELLALKERCGELARQQRWQEIDAVCQQVLARADLSGAQRAGWMCRWASWMYREGLAGGRVRFGRVRALLDDALAMAAPDPRVTAEICVGQTAIGYNVDDAVRRFRRLLAQHPELKEFAGPIYFNLGYDLEYVTRLVPRAAQAYKEATQYLEGHRLGRAWYSYAHCCIQPGRLREARNAIRQGEEFVSDSDRPLVLYVKALLALAEQAPATALRLVQEGLQDPHCDSWGKAHLYYAAVLTHHETGNSEEAQKCIQMAWHHAAEVRNTWVLTRLGLLLPYYPLVATSQAEGG